MKEKRKNNPKKMRVGKEIFINIMKRHNIFLFVSFFITSKMRL